MKGGRASIVADISARHGLAKADVLLVINEMMASIVRHLKRREVVELRGLGSFKVVQTKQMVGRNPKKPENVVIIPPKMRLKFYPSDPLRKMVEAMPTNTSPSP